MNQKNEAIARAYLDAVSSKRLEKLNDLLADDVRFVGPAASHDTREGVCAALKRVSSIHVKSEIKRVFADGSDVCVIYDFVTDAIGVLETIEWLTIENGRIQSIHLYYDQLPWQKAREEITRRAQAAAQANA